MVRLWKAVRPVHYRCFKVIFYFFGIEADRFFDFVDLALLFDGNTKGVSYSIKHIEKTTNEREVDHLGLAEFIAYLFIDTVVLLSSVERDMRRP